MKKQDNVEETKRVYNNIHEIIKKEQHVHAMGALTIIISELLFSFCKLYHDHNKLTQDKFFEETLCGLSDQIVDAYSQLKKQGGGKLSDE